MRIVELVVDENLFDDQFIGVDGIALVKRPATEETWLAFNQYKNLKQPYEVLTDEEMVELAEALVSIGETHEDLLEDGYELVSVTPIKDKEEFVGSIESYPNETSMEDTAGYRIRYKYTGPRDNKNRDFCAVMLEGGKVYRKEDIDRMTADSANDEFGYYDIFKWRGSYNCRHVWSKLVYKQKDPNKNELQNTILNNNKRRRNLIETQDIPNEPTITEATANNQRVRLSQVGEVDGYPLYDNREEAHQVAKIIGCQGIHIHEVNGKDYYMPCAKHPTQMNDLIEVPQYVRDAACKARQYKEENPDNDCGTRVGWVRSSQLCNEGKVSVDILKRMASFARHIPNAEKQTSYDEGCALLMVDAWGGIKGIEWSQAELDRLENREEMEGLEGACWPGYEAIGTKIKDGKEVPNCVPVSNSKEGFSKLEFNYNEEKMEVTGAAMVPNKFIIRHNHLGEPYYVYFSKDTIKKLSQKFMRDKLTDSTNIEHSNKKAKDTYVTESWLVSDEFVDKSSALGLNYPQGTWVITMKTDDPEVWKEIKEGKYEGFSVEGYFEEKVVFTKEDQILNGIKTLLNQTKDDQ